MVACYRVRSYDKMWNNTRIIEAIFRGKKPTCILLEFERISLCTFESTLVTWKMGISRCQNRVVIDSINAE